MVIVITVHHGNQEKAKGVEYRREVHRHREVHPEGAGESKHRRPAEHRLQVGGKTCFLICASAT